MLLQMLLMHAHTLTYTHAGFSKSLFKQSVPPCLEQTLHAAGADVNSGQDAIVKSTAGTADGRRHRCTPDAITQ